MKQFVRFSVSASALPWIRRGHCLGGARDPAPSSTAALSRREGKGNGWYSRDTLCRTSCRRVALACSAALAPDRCSSGHAFAPIAPNPLQGQASVPQPPQSEDCLTINVVASGQLQKALRPVMVWVHGGAFLSVRATRWRSPTLHWCDAGSCSSRSTTESAGSGSSLIPRSRRIHARPTKTTGFSDQIAALQWVQRNIAPAR